MNRLTEFLNLTKFGFMRKRKKCIVHAFRRDFENFSANLFYVIL